MTTSSVDVIEVWSRSAAEFLPPNPDGKQKKQWVGVEIIVNGSKIHPTTTIQEPFFDEENTNWLELYHLGKLTTESHKEVALRIKNYQQSLFDQLRLGNTKFKTRHRQIFIHEELPDGEEQGSIHALDWELLEDLNLWCQGLSTERPELVGITHVYARTHHEQPRFTAEDKASGQSDGEVKCSPRGPPPPFRLLLVVARSWRMEANTWTEPPADIVQLSLCRIIKKLRAEGYMQRLEIEIVRPGTFEALKAHLEGGMNGFYDLIHFDIHGLIKEDAR
jgi:hypothetical protein